MTSESSSKYWLDLAADDIVSKYPEGTITVSSGHSPSGVYHIGTIREIATASALTWALRERGREATHLDFVDDFDVLRKIPADLPETIQSELGKPLYLAESPKPGSSYADYFYNDLVAATQATGFEPDESYRASTTYGKEHRYTAAIEKVLKQTQEIREIIETVSHRKLSADWGPVQLLSDSGRLNEWIYSGHDTERQIVTYRALDGKEGELSYAEGRVKLDWRIDWPARWWMWGVNVEPFGRDHATKGGSYDTGRAIVEQVFGGQAPMPVPYEFINQAGQTKKISKSAGNVITPKEVLKVMPVEILRYFIVRSRPEKLLIFATGLGLFNLIDEFAAAQNDSTHPFRDAYEFAVAGKTDRVISSVSFKHLVQVYQAAQGDPEQTLLTLERTGYGDTVKTEKDIILQELPFVHNWLEHYAPDVVKFSVQEKLPRAELGAVQKTFLAKLADAIQTFEGDLNGREMHLLIYAAAEKAEVGPREGFAALYRVILGKEYGPKAGWFLASLDRDWLVKRLKLEG